MTTPSRPPLSPAAQAVMDAYEAAPIVGVYPQDADQLAIAAALRALADHHAPAWAGTGPACHWHPDDRTRRELRNIAAELEGHG